MTFLAVFLVLLAVQYGGVERFLHRDGWLVEWQQRVAKRIGSARLSAAVTIMVPLFGLWLLLDWCEALSPVFMFLVSLPLLVYSLGRDNVSLQVQHYVDAARREDNVAAVAAADELGLAVEPSNTWPELHRAVLRQVGYKVLEGRFAPLFWFVILGPLGAVFYRLAYLTASYAQEHERDLLVRLVAWLEWPAVRLLGLSLALTGNFSSCINQCWDSLLDSCRSSTTVLEHCVHGALNLNQQGVVAESVSEHEVEALQPLFSRTLVLWVCVLALVSLF